MALRIAALCLSAAGLLGASPAAQLVLLDEDFDAGLPPGWTTDQEGVFQGDDWTVGFGQVNGSGDMNHEWYCTGGNSSRNNRLVSPALDLSGLANIVLEFDQFHLEMGGLLGPNKYNRVEVSVDFGAWNQIYDVPESPAPDGFSSVALSLNAYAGQSHVRIGFHYRGSVTTDWSVDDVRVTAVWHDVGQGLGGSFGTPDLNGLGDLEVGAPMGISLTGAAPASAAYLVVGFAELGLPFYGGTLVPAFEPPLGTFFPLSTNGAGGLSLGSTWPAGVPSGSVMTLQCWVVDAGAPFGLSASNAVRGHVP